MPIAIEALIPVIGCVIIGFVLRHRFRITGDVWNALEKLTYFLFAPCLLVVSLANKPLEQLAWEGIVSTLLIVLLTCSVIIVAVQLCFKPFDGPSFTSVFQGSVRFNSYLTLAIAEQLFGQEGLAIAALSVAVVVISVNILSISAFSLASNLSGGWKRLPKQLITNPLLMSCVVGLLLNFSGIGVQGSMETLLLMLGKATLPMALLAVGAALQIASTRGYLNMIVISSFIQLILKPIMAYVLCVQFGLDPISSIIVILCLAVPTAPSSYILARQLGGNAPAMAAIITVQTLLAFISLPAVLSVVLNG